VILLPAIISSLANVLSGAASASASGGSQPSAVSDSQFKSLVAALTVNGTPVGSSASTPTNAATAANAIVAQMIGKNVHMSDAARQLSDRISALLANGTSMTQIVSTLASNLAQQVGAALGKTDDASVANLKTAFASALSPPGNGPPDAAALLDRLRHLGAIVNKALGTSMGQQNRLSGNTLDANAAGGNPAPNQTQTTASLNGAPAQGNIGSQGSGLSRESILESAFTALSGSIDSPQTAAQTIAGAQAFSAAQTSLPSQTTAQTPLSNQSLVASSSLDAAGTGGGTLLGRTLTRAANAAADLGANPLSAFNTPVPTSLASSGTSQQTSPDAKDGSTSTSGGAATATLAASGSAAAAPNATVAAFLQAFQRALAMNANAIQTGASLPDQTQTDDAAPAASNGTGNVQPLLASLGVIQDAQTPPSSTLNTPVAQQTAPTTADPNLVVAQLLRGIMMRDLGTTSEVRLRLVPESLGDLNVKLTVDNTGSVNASVVAQTPEARDTLLANQNQLTRSLSDAGLKLTSFNVDLSNSGTNMFGQQQPQPQQRYGFGLRAPLVSSDDAGSDPLSAIPSFAPPSAVAAGAGVLNYLA